MIAGYDERFRFLLIGLGESYEEILLEKKDWLTGQHVRSEAKISEGLYEYFYIAFIGEYAKCRCAETGQHHFIVKTNAGNISNIYNFGTLRLKGE